MWRKNKKQILLTLLFLFFAFPCLASNIIINELAWMGTTNSANDEWIELYNTTGQDIDLTDWTLTADDGTPNITLLGIIAANGYFLMERTDDSSVPNITADQIYVGALGNTGEKLELKDNQNNLIDSIDNSSEWTAGDNTTKQTMELNNSTWQTSQDAGGTPKAQNSTGSSTPDEQVDDGITSDGGEAPTPPNRPPLAKAGTDITALINQELSFDASQSSDPDNDTLTYFWNFGDGATDTKEKTTHTYTFPGQYLVSLLVSDSQFSDLDIITINIYSPSVIISEFNNQWIELYNQSDQVANLTNWQLNDFVFPANSLIGPKQFLVLTKQITKIDLDDNNDQVKLIYPDGSVGTEVNYLAEDKEDFCIAFDGAGYFWTKVATPGAANIISAAGLENEQNYQTNNPEPVIRQTQEPQVLATTTILTQGQEFKTQNPPTSSTKFLNDPKNVQPASLIQKTQNSQKSDLILYLSIIISASLLLSWVIIRLRKKPLNP